MEGSWLVVVWPLGGRNPEVHSTWPWRWMAGFMAWWVAPQYLRVKTQWHPDGVSWISAKPRR